MSKDSIQNIDTCPNERVSAGLVMCLICAAGLGCTICALFSPGLEWRILSIAAPAAAVNPFVAEVRSRWKNDSIHFSLTHCLLFAGVLALGPLGASLPAALGAAFRLVVENSSRKPLHQVLYAIVKPAAVCSFSSFVYVILGGNVIRPQQVDSFVPLLFAAVAYIGANMLLAAVDPKSSKTETGRLPGTLSVFAGWSLCIFSGYALAVLYAIAPSYVLLALAAPAVLAYGALFATSNQPLLKEKAEQEPKAESQSKDESPKSGSAFIDPVTGLANRRYLELFLKNELNRSERAERPLSIAVFDLDEFKSTPEIEDETAREALVAMGEKLKAEVRDYDLVANYSSTRLVAVFPEASAQEAEEIAQRLHECVVSAGPKAKPLSVSVGISTFPEHGSTSEDLINASHRALNQGRFLGPNRVHSFRELQKAS